MAPDDKDDGEDISEWLVAEDTTEATWLRLKRLTSSVLCERILAKRTQSLDLAAVARKAEQTAWAVRSALGYWEAGGAGLNARVLSRYYALLQISIAEQVAFPNSTANLEEVQRHTESGGHGLFTLVRPNERFPANYYVGAVKKGHFFEYAKHRGINLDATAFGGRPAAWPREKPDQISRLVALDPLFARIPELQTTIDEYLDIAPLSFHIVAAQRNMTEDLARKQQNLPNMGPFDASPLPAPGAEKTSYVSLVPTSSKVTLEFLKSLSLPFLELETETDSFLDRTLFTGKLNHPVEEHWFKNLELYKSGYSGTSYIVPLWGGIRDPFIIHFLILYALSIVVRYLPSLWHEIEDGSLDNVRALIEHYLAIVDSVLPRMAVQRITGRRLVVVQPGSLEGPL